MDPADSSVRGSVQKIIQMIPEQMKQLLNQRNLEGIPLVAHRIISQAVDTEAKGRRFRSFRHTGLRTVSEMDSRI